MAKELTLAGAYNALVRAGGKGASLLFSRDSIRVVSDYQDMQIPIDLDIAKRIAVLNPKLLKSGQSLICEDGALKVLSSGVSLPIASMFSGVMKDGDVVFPYVFDSAKDADLVNNRGAHVFTVSIETRHLEYVAFASSLDSARDEMYTMIGCDRNGNLFATDGARLAYYQPKPSVPGDPVGCAFLTRGSLKLSQDLKEGFITVDRYENSTLLSIGKVRLAVTYSENKYRDFTQILPKVEQSVWSHILTADEIAFAEKAVQLTNLAKAKSGQKEVETTMYFREGVIGVYSKELDLDTTAPSQCMVTGGKASFDAKLFYEGVSYGPDLLPTLFLYAPNKPAMLTKGIGDLYTYLVMPCRVY